MKNAPLRTGARVALAITAVGLITGVSRALLGLSNGYIPGDGNWIDYWAVQVALILFYALIAFGAGYIVRLVLNKFQNSSSNSEQQNRAFQNVLIKPNQILSRIKASTAITVSLILVVGFVIYSALPVYSFFKPTGAAGVVYRANNITGSLDICITTKDNNLMQFNCTTASKSTVNMRSKFTAPDTNSNSPRTVISERPILPSDIVLEEVKKGYDPFDIKTNTGIKPVLAVPPW
jgi:hypothetical protein